MKKLLLWARGLGKRRLDLVVVSGLLALVLVVARVNVELGTWFMGWDSVMSELNFGESFSRAIGGVWQEYQGLGLVGGHGYVSDLVHVSLLWLLARVVPLMYLRYAFTFLMWFMGCVGVYVLVEYVLGKSKLAKVVRVSAGGLGALVYLLHLAAVSNVYVQLDSFLWYYGFLPWSLVTLLWVWDRPSKKRLLMWLMVNFGMSFVGFIPPVFLGYVMIVGLIGTARLKRKGLLSGLREWVVVMGLLVVANLYWLLPVGYFILTQKEVYLNSKLNRLTTSENVVKSRGYGDWESVVLGKGIYFESLDFASEEDRSVSILEVWEQQVEKPWVKAVWYVVFGLGLVGLVLGGKLMKRDRWWGLGAASVGMFGVMANEVWPFSVVVGWLHQIPVINQAFRIPFTKFSIGWVMFAALLVAVGVGVVGRILEKVWGKWGKWMSVVLVIVAAGMVLVASKPLFEGNLLYQRSKVELPDEYGELMKYLEGENIRGRVAVFPVHSFNGWYIHDWGYTGSGFVFYGVGNPVLDRAFDVWSDKNETYYKQMARAVYDQDERVFWGLLRKYEIRWIFVDESVVDLNQGQKSLKIGDVVLWLEGLGLEKEWGQGKLSLYKTGAGKNTVGNVGVVDEAVWAESGDYLRNDVAFAELGDYVSSNFEIPEVRYPMSWLEKESLGDGGGLFEVENDTRIRVSGGRGKEGEVVVIPGMRSGEGVWLDMEMEYETGRVVVKTEAPIRIWQGEELVLEYQLPDFVVEVPEKMEELLVAIGDRRVRVELGEMVKVGGVRLEVGKPVEVDVYNLSQRNEEELSESFLTSELSQCWTRSNAEGDLRDEKQGDVRKIYAEDASGCLSMKLGNYDADKALVTVGLRYKSNGRSRPNFCVVREGGDYVCENDEVFYSTEPSEMWGVVEREMVLEGRTNYWIDISARPPDEKGKGWEIEYKAPEVVWYPLVGEHLFEQNFWGDFLKEQKVEMSAGGGEVSVEVGTRENEIRMEDRGREELPNCDIQERGTVEKGVVEGKVKYEVSNGGAGCDFVIAEELSNKQGYLLTMSGEVVTGKGLKIYVNNLANERNDVEELLRGSFRETMPLLPWSSLSDEGYKLILETRSFGSGEAVNEIVKVTVYPVPIEWLAGVKVVDGDVTRLVGNLEVGEVEKVGTWYYRAEVTGDEGVVSLGQGYDEGWLGYEVSGSSWLARWMPWFAGEKLEHVRVNGWGNGWILRNDKLQITNAKLSGFGEVVKQVSADEGEAAERVVVMVFWPQYLEWLGFGLLGLCVMVLVWSGKQKVDRHGGDSKIGGN